MEEDGSINDDYRIDYLRAHVEEMMKAVTYDDVDLMGYTPWGCIDCVSFTTGQYSKRYGFIYVNKHDDGTGDMSRSRSANRRLNPTSRQPVPENCPLRTTPSRSAAR